MRYFDASALVKLLVTEAESEALRAHLANSLVPAVTSLVGVAETSIAAARRGAPEHAAASVAVENWLLVPAHAIHALDVSAELAQSAATFGASHGLRTLDAIHVATADAIRGSLVEVVTYDKSMIAACQALGLRVVSPGA